MIEHNQPVVERMRAIKIDPDRCSVELIDVEPDDVAGILGSERTDTLDFEKDHCLVIDDGSHTTDHPTRFRFAGGAVDRPFFGSALILGSEHGNWASATLKTGPLRTRIIWEHWDRRQRRYASQASTKA